MKNTGYSGLTKMKSTFYLFLKDLSNFLFYGTFNISDCIVLNGRMVGE
jgi:hypothetical protein